MTPELHEMAKSLRISALQLRAHDRAAFTERRDTLMRRIDEAARSADMSVNVWAMRCFEACLSRKE